MEEKEELLLGLLNEGPELCAVSAKKRTNGIAMENNAQTFKVDLSVRILIKPRHDLPEQAVGIFQS